MMMRNLVSPDHLPQCRKGGLVDVFAGQGTPGVTLETGQPGLSRFRCDPAGGEPEHLIIDLIVTVAAPGIEEYGALASPAVEQP